MSKKCSGSLQIEQKMFRREKKMFENRIFLNRTRNVTKGTKKMLAMKIEQKVAR